MRVSGVTIPQNKQIGIALTYIYGVGLTSYHTHNAVDSTLINRIANKLPIAVYGSGAPTSTPLAIGDIYVDTAASPTKKVYVATGRSSSSDWTVVN